MQAKGRSTMCNRTSQAFRNNQSDMINLFQEFDTNDMFTVPNQHQTFLKENLKDFC